MNSRRRYFLVAVIILTGLFLTACGAKEAEIKEEVQAVLVETTDAAIASISDISTVNGKLAAQVQVDVVPKTPGKVGEVNFEVGDRVHKGDILVRLESTEIQAQLKQVQAGLKISQAAYGDAKKNLDRMETLYQQGAISQQQLEAAQTGLVAGSPDAAAASVQLMQAQLANTVITSPADGIIASRNIDVGEMAYQSPVMTIVDIDKVVVETTVTEAEVNKLKTGQGLDVFVNAVSDRPFKGTITNISPMAESRSGAFPIKIEVANANHNLKPGMFAEIKLVLSTREGVTVIPKEAVVDSGEGKYVFQVKDGLAIQTTIKTGVEDDSRIEVVFGLTPGETVVLSGQNKLQDKSPVTVSGGMK